jgi:hypothetical protein
MGDSAASSRAYSTPESSASQMNSQAISSYDHSPNPIPPTVDASGEPDFSTDIGMHQCLGTYDLAVAEIALCQQPMSDFIFDSTVTTNLQIMADPTPQHNFIGQHFLSNPDGYIRTPVPMFAGESGDTIRIDNQRVTVFGPIDTQDAFF